MGSEALKCTFLGCTYILTTLKAKIMTTGPHVLERNNFIVCIYECILYTPANLNTAKLQIIKHYFTKPG